MYNFLQLTLYLWQDYLQLIQLFNSENYLKYSKCIKIKILAFWYIFIIFILTQNGSSTLPLKYSSAGWLLMCPPGNSGSTACLLSPPCFWSLRQASTERGGRWMAWKTKGDRFASRCVLYSSKCALNTGSYSDTSASLLPEICEGLREEEGGRG